ncbi:MAG: PEP-CTERM sorting domain-containing protein [Phycisphaerae bacterium]|nr:PEP-CTERM sorting domain-containing protein [Phycisphaerae bacterium]
MRKSVVIAILIYFLTGQLSFAAWTEEMLSAEVLTNAIYNDAVNLIDQAGFNDESLSVNFTKTETSFSYSIDSVGISASAIMNQDNSWSGATTGTYLGIDLSHSWTSTAFIEAGNKGEHEIIIKLSEWDDTVLRKLCGQWSVEWSVTGAFGSSSHASGVTDTIRRFNIGANDEYWKVTYTTPDPAKPAPKATVTTQAQTPYSDGTGTIEIETIPEPTTIVLLGLGGLALIGTGHKR